MEIRDDGRGKRFSKPTEKGIYAIGADVAEGLQTGDASSAVVIDKELNICATWHGKVDPDQFGELLCRLGSYYNNALIAVEINNHGHATSAAIKRRGYLNVYTRVTKEERGEGYTKKIGWQTNLKTKGLMIDTFVACVRDNTCEVTDTDLLKEMVGLSVEPDGKVILNGQDRTVAICIALQAIGQANSGDFKAKVPYAETITPKTIKEKIDFYERRRVADNQFGE